MTLNLEQYVSAVTIEKFRIYERLLQEWNCSTGLVQESTLQQFDVRHILDSLQIIPIIHELSAQPPENNSTQNNGGCTNNDFRENPLSMIVDRLLMLDTPPDKLRKLSMIDVGTGAGFPGIVLAMCGFQDVQLCETNEKKCIFLEEVARQTSTSVVILNQRIEEVVSKYDIILSRAFTELDRLLDVMSTNCRNQNSYGVFHKGKSWEDENHKARKRWNYKSRIYRSVTSQDGVIMSIHNLSKK